MPGKDLAPGIEPPESTGRVRPVQLHLVHNWGGGAARWVEDFCRADRTRQNLILKPIADEAGPGTRLALYGSPNDARPLACWALDPPLASCAAAHPGYRAILREVVEAYGVEAILVSSLVGHSLDALATGLPTAVVLHDYFPLCPAMHVAYVRARSPDRRPAGSAGSGDPRRTAGKGTVMVCTSCCHERLSDCLAHNGHCRFFDDLTAANVQAIRDRFVAMVQSGLVALVAPSPCVARHVAMIEPRLSKAAFRVIPHGVEPLRREGENANRPKLAGRRPTAVVLGRLSPEKGVELLAQALPRLSQWCDVVLLGCGEGGQSLAGPGVKAIPAYDRHELAALLDQLDPDFGLLLSIVPETFSYTLSEMMACGIPPVATDRGSFVDRIEEGVNGFLFEPCAEELLAKVKGLCGRPDLLAEVRRNLTRFRPQSPEEMVARYHEVLPVRASCESGSARGSGLSRSPRLPTVSAMPQLAPDKTFEAAVKDLYAVARVKLATTPRLKPWQRPVARWLLAGAYGLVKIGFRLAGRRRRRKAA